MENRSCSCRVSHGDCWIYSTECWLSWFSFYRGSR